MSFSGDWCTRRGIVNFFYSIIILSLPHTHTYIHSGTCIAFFFLLFLLSLALSFCLFYSFINSIYLLSSFAYSLFIPFFIYSFILFLLVFILLFFLYSNCEVEKLLKSLRDIRESSIIYRVSWREWRGRRMTNNVRD